MDPKESKPAMSDQERLELCKKLDKDLDEYIDGLEKRSYAEGWPEDRWEEEMEKHPFFMRKAPNSGDATSPLIEGLQNLKYDAEENTPEELATNYKEDGNYNYKYKNYRLAILSYTEGLKAKCGNTELQAQLLNNRSASQFMLNNYRSALKDGEACLRLQPSHSKARLRAAQCCLKIGSYDECIKHCDILLKENPTEAKMKKIRAEAVSSKKKADRNSRLETQKARARTKETDALIKALREREVKVFNEDDDDDSIPNLESLHPAAEGAKVCLGEDGRLTWPCLILYPEHGISDLVRHWHEDVSFSSQLSEMFSERAEWDHEGKYTPGAISCYFEGDENTRSIHKINLSTSLGEVLSDKRYTVVAGTPKFIVFVEGSRSEKNFLAKYVLS